MKWILLILILNSDATNSEMNSLAFETQAACQSASTRVTKDFNTTRGIHVRTICLQRTSLINDWMGKKGKDL